ncbi:putative syndetin [Blattamonas nauphoetae]|uniref:Syndetin n=1 Tax=Blattamonas nauphoetae TaxID=2049346 RepID=A0ABQ9X007_9EUKA|nr:putative syndetin [Blattamonas nauphoetae]
MIKLPQSIDLSQPIVEEEYRDFIETISRFGSTPLTVTALSTVKETKSSELARKNLVLSRTVLQNYDSFIVAMTKIQEMSMLLQQGYNVVRESRSSLTKADDILCKQGERISSMSRQKNALLQVLDILDKLRQFSEVGEEVQRCLEQNDYRRCLGAILRCVEFKEIYERFSFLSHFEDHLIQNSIRLVNRMSFVLADSCLAFDESSLLSVLGGFEDLRKLPFRLPERLSQNPFDHITSLFLQQLNNNATSSLISCLKTHAPTFPALQNERSLRQSFITLSRSLPSHLFLPLLSAFFKSLSTLLISYSRVLNCITTHCDDFAFGRELRDQMMDWRTEYWSLIQRKTQTLFQSLSFSETKLEKVISIYLTISRFIVFGQGFCGKDVIATEDSPDKTAQNHATSWPNNPSLMSSLLDEDEYEESKVLIVLTRMFLKQFYTRYEQTCLTTMKNTLSTEDWAVSEKIIDLGKLLHMRFGTDDSEAEKWKRNSKESDELSFVEKIDKLGNPLEHAITMPLTRLPKHRDPTLHLKSVEKLDKESRLFKSAFTDKHASAERDEDEDDDDTTSKEKWGEFGYVFTKTSHCVIHLVGKLLEIVGYFGFLKLEVTYTITQLFRFYFYSTSALFSLPTSVYIHACPSLPSAIQLPYTIRSIIDQANMNTMSSVFSSNTPSSISLNMSVTLPSSQDIFTKLLPYLSFYKPKRKKNATVLTLHSQPANSFSWTQNKLEDSHKSVFSSFSSSQSRRSIAPTRPHRSPSPSSSSPTPHLSSSVPGLSPSPSPSQKLPLAYSPISPIASMSFASSSPIVLCPPFVIPSDRLPPFSLCLPMVLVEGIAKAYLHLAEGVRILGMVDEKKKGERRRGEKEEEGKGKDGKEEFERPRGGERKEESNEKGSVVSKGDTSSQDDDSKHESIRSELHQSLTRMKASLKEAVSKKESDTAPPFSVAIPVVYPPTSSPPASTGVGLSLGGEVKEEESWVADLVMRPSFTVTSRLVAALSLTSLAVFFSSLQPIFSALLPPIHLAALFPPILTLVKDSHRIAAVIERNVAMSFLDLDNLPALLARTQYDVKEMESDCNEWVRTLRSQLSLFNSAIQASLTNVPPTLTDPLLRCLWSFGVEGAVEHILDALAGIRKISTTGRHQLMIDLANVESSLSKLLPQPLSASLLLHKLRELREALITTETVQQLTHWMETHIAWTPHHLNTLLSLHTLNSTRESRKTLQPVRTVIATLAQSRSTHFDSTIVEDDRDIQNTVYPMSLTHYAIPGPPPFQLWGGEDK